MHCTVIGGYFTDCKDFTCRFVHSLKGSLAIIRLAKQNHILLISEGRGQLQRGRRERREEPRSRNMLAYNRVCCVWIHVFCMPKVLWILFSGWRQRLEAIHAHHHRDTSNTDVCSRSHYQLGLPTFLGIPSLVDTWFPLIRSTNNGYHHGALPFSPIHLYLHARGVW